MKLPYTEELEIQYLNRLFDNTSECYKFFWFQAVINKVLEGHDVITYEELINEMIVDSWYMVTEFHRQGSPAEKTDFDVPCTLSSSGAIYGKGKRRGMECFRTPADPEH